MMAHLRKVAAVLGSAMLLAFILAGCMTERAPVDKTNPLALDKRLFEGDWFYKQTVTDLPYSVDYSFIGETNDLKMIRWEITQNWLIAYSLYDTKNIVDTEGKQDLAETPVLAFPILDQFDIELAENTTTGEDLPILTENRDNPWWQTRYMVIDPSSSALTNFEMKYLNMTIDWDNPFYYEPVAGYYQMEWHDKNNQAINPKEYEMRHMAGGDQLADSLSFYTDVIVSPNNSWRNIYTWEDVYEFISWEPARMEYRHFFWRVDREELDNNGFVPLEYQDDMFRRFGFFTRDYRAVDPQYGYRDNYIHKWANYFNIENGHKIITYLSPNFPEYLALTTCSIAADYNYAFAKAKYEGQMARESFDENGEGFESDFGPQIKLADGLSQMVTGISEDNPATSLFMPDAFETWPEDMTLDDSKFYYLDYTIESQVPPSDWNDEDQGAFTDRQAAMIAEMKRYCFTEDENDVFVLRRNEFLEYDYDRDGVNPEGLPNLITPDEIRAIFGDDIDSRVAVPVNYPVACEVTREHRCEVDSEGNKVPRYKAELGDARYSFFYWVDTPTEYGILGVSQWSDNPETGQILSASSHIAGSVLQWSTHRELERYFMIKGMRDGDSGEDDDLFAGFNPTRERYEELLNDLIIDAEYTNRPTQGEVQSRPEDEVNPPPVMPGSPEWKTSSLHNPAFRELSLGKKSDELSIQSNKEKAEMLKVLQAKHLPTIQGALDLSAIKGTRWETEMAMSGVLDFVFPEATAYNEEMLYGISPLYWGTKEAMIANRDREIELSKGCYFMGEWLDGGFLEIIEKMDDAGYSREDIRRAVERIMFKGVAEHEMGHSLGLRHNFNASADELNYIGDQWVNEDGELMKTGYWKAKPELQKDLDAKIAEFKTKKGRDPVPIEKFYLQKTIATPMDWYMYSSVMDYMDEFYFHGFGLGKYDIAAFLYVYGKGVEKYKLDGSNNVEMNEYGLPKVVVEPLLEYRYCTADDLYNITCSCVPGSPKDGQNDEDCVCTDKAGMTYCYNPKVPVWELRYEPEVTLDLNEEKGVTHAMPVEGSRVGIQLNGDIKPYLFGTDHWRYEDPMCNVWDKGYTARDIIRNMADQYKRFYFWRFFRRGNPRFRRQRAFWGSFWRMFPFAHFALDLNYYRFQLPEWQDILTGRTTDPQDPSNSLARKDYMYAVNGIEEWTEVINGQEVTKTLTPGGAGDYLIAGMEGYNFLVYDVLYSPDVGKHVLTSWLEDENKQYFVKNPYIYDEATLEETLGGAILDVDLRYGHHHKNHWNRQDDLGIMEEKLMVKGFTIEKDAAGFVLTNAGWPVDKYGYENMANAFAYLSDGFDNANYNLMSDIMNEDHMLQFSRYCVEQTGVNKYKMKVYQPPVNMLHQWNWTDDWAQPATGETPNPNDYKPDAVDNTMNMCQRLSAQEGKTYFPIHASWVYFDKVEPIFWSIFNQANTMADNTVFQYYTTDIIPVGERHLWAAPNEDEIEVLNSKETYYYRAHKVPGDDRSFPAYDLLERYRNIRMLCAKNATLENPEYGEGTAGMVPGNFYTDECPGTPYPASYLNNTLEHMESTMTLLNDFSSFWQNMSNWTIGY